MKTMRWMLWLSLSALLSLGVLSACGPQVSPSLRLDLESTSLTPGEPVKLFVLVTNFKLDKASVGQNNQNGIGHYAVYLGDDTKPLYTGADFPYLLTIPKNSKAGKTKLRVVLLQNSGAPLEANIEQSLDVNVKDIKPVVTLSSENTGIVAGEEMEVTIRVSNFRLQSVEDKLDNKEGQGHYKLFLGEEATEPLLVGHKTVVKLRIPYSTKPGGRALRLVLYNNDGSKIEPTIQGRLQLNIKEPPAPTVSLELSKKEVKAGEPLILRVKVENFRLSGASIGQKHEPGVGHYRVYLDDKQGENFEAEGTASEFELLVPPELDAGSHSVRVVLFQNDKTPMVPSIESKATFQVLPPPDNKPGLKVRLTKSTVAPGESVELEVTVVNFVFAPGSIDKLPKPGAGHFRVYLDDKTGMEYVAVGAKQQFQFTLPKDTKPGERKLRISLRENDGSPLSPVVETTVKLEVPQPPPAP